MKESVKIISKSNIGKELNKFGKMYHKKIIHHLFLSRKLSFNDVIEHVERGKRSINDVISRRERTTGLKMTLKLYFSNNYFLLPAPIYIPTTIDCRPNVKLHFCSIFDKLLNIIIRNYNRIFYIYYERPTREFAF